MDAGGMSYTEHITTLGSEFVKSRLEERGISGSNVPFRMGWNGSPYTGPLYDTLIHELGSVHATNHCHRRKLPDEMVSRMRRESNQFRTGSFDLNSIGFQRTPEALWWRASFHVRGVAELIPWGSVIQLQYGSLFENPYGQLFGIAGEGFHTERVYAYRINPYFDDPREFNFTQDTNGVLVVNPTLEEQPVADGAAIEIDRIVSVSIDSRVIFSARPVTQFPFGGPPWGVNLRQGGSLGEGSFPTNLSNSELGISVSSNPILLPVVDAENPDPNPLSQIYPYQPIRNVVSGEAGPGITRHDFALEVVFLGAKLEESSRIEEYEDL